MVKALCQRIRQGDAEASEALLRMFEPTLQRMATALQNAMYICHWKSTIMRRRAV